MVDNSRGADAERGHAVPPGVELAAAWAWRFLIICAAGYAVVWVLAYFAVITLPLIVALLISALASPLVRRLNAIGIPTAVSAGLVVLFGIGIVMALLTFAGRQVVNGAGQLGQQVVRGLAEVQAWLKEGPLNVSDAELDTYLNRAQNAITEFTREGDLLGRLTEFGVTVGHVFAGLFIVLFSTYFFLADGGRIWSWFVRLAPRAARTRVDSSGRVAWISLTQFVRATVLVALADAIGIMIVAAALRVPLVLAIGVLVFLGAFIPMVGATIAGTVAILVALVDQGPWTALLMLGGVIVVQQIEGHVLQPFLMGRLVAVHPLAVIIAIGAGVLVAGIAGALIAVPLAAAVNAVAHHLAGGSPPPGHDSPEQDDPDDNTAESEVGDGEVREDRVDA
jgi:predicted PurR-regulated permease PerM